MEQASNVEAPVLARPADPSTLSVALLALLGYGVLAASLVLLGVACVLLFHLLVMRRFAFVAVKLGLVLVPLAWIILRSLWVRIEPPTGLTLEEADAPRLFELVERVRRAIGAPRVDTILMVEDLNAGVAHVPWLGLFGPGRTFLVVGLPLLQGLTEPQLEAVLAHEFGHVSGKHTRFGAWVYRARLTWARLVAQLQGLRVGAPLRAFIRWYYPRFDAASLVVARAQELQADRESAEFAGARTAADALIATQLLGRLLGERLWTELARRNASVTQPPSALFAETRALLTGGLAPELATRWVRHALAEAEDPTDTHPPLAERLRHLGQTERVPPPGLPASQTLLGTSEARLEQALGRWWSERAAEGWQLRHRSLQKQRLRLRELEKKRALSPLPVDEAWQRADLVEDFRGEAEALPLFEEVLERAPDHARAHLSVGRILVLRDDAAAVSHLERAAQLDRRLEGAACELLGLYWTRQGRPEEGQAARSRLERWERLAAEARAERSGLGLTDALAPHELHPPALDQLRRTLERFPTIHEAWLARKVLRHFPEDPLFVLAVRAGTVWALRNAEKAAELARGLLPELQLPGAVLVVDLFTQRALADHVRGSAGSAVYRRAR